MNDGILRHTANILPKMGLSRARIETWLTVIEYMEVFVEMAAEKIAGNVGKWILITCIHITKAAMRFVLLLKHKCGIQSSPPISPMDREGEMKKTVESKLLPFAEARKETAFTLKHSGRVVRTLESAPPIGYRTWKLPNDPERNSLETEHKLELESPLTTDRVVAESLHITRPLIHLLSMYAYGRHSWKPWLLSAGIDLTSLLMTEKRDKLLKHEKVEVRRRSFMFLYYLLRSPFYDQVSKARINILLRLLSDNVPLVGLMLRPFLEYLPQWQRMYFYVWAL
ncbi:peroxisomal membrane protein PEX16-like isoform X2 [Tubulanus polymorphus]